MYNFLQGMERHFTLSNEKRLVLHVTKGARRAGAQIQNFVGVMRSWDGIFIRTNLFCEAVPGN